MSFEFWESFQHTETRLCWAFDKCREDLLGDVARPVEFKADRKQVKGVQNAARGRYGED